MMDFQRENMLFSAGAATISGNDYWSGKMPIYSNMEMYPRVPNTMHMSHSPGDDLWTDLGSFGTNHDSSLNDNLEHSVRDMSLLDSGTGAHIAFTERPSSQYHSMYGRFEPPADFTTASHGSSGPYSLSSIYSQQGFSKLQDQDDEEHHTPASLGWSRDSANVNFYELMIPKAEEPFLKLRPEHQATSQTPPIVYFDKPEILQKGVYPCVWPGTCDRKNLHFSRSADLDRHLKNVHTINQKDEFPCDYGHCSSGRQIVSFTRKDHFRDHLGDFHKEDIGAAKGEKSARTEKEKKQWQKNQKHWLAERHIQPDWWRCAKCLVKKQVTRDGWECSTCKVECEPERVDARMRLTGANDVRSSTQAEGSQEFPQYPYLPKTSESGFQAYCGTCNGTVWVDNEFGEWEPCPACGSFG